MIQAIVLSKYDRIFRIFASSYISKISQTPLIVIDDGLSEKTKEEYSHFEYRNSPHYNGHFAFVLAVNDGIEAAKDDSDILLFNDDTIIHTEDLDLKLKKVASVAYSKDNVGLIAPLMTNVMNDMQNPEQKKDVLYRITDHVISFPCVYIKRQAIEKVGLMDESYKYGGCGAEDKDYCHELWEAGFKLAIAQNCFVQHGGEKFGKRIRNSRGSAKPREKLNMKYFKQKWE